MKKYLLLLLSLFVLAGCQDTETVEESSTDVETVASEIEEISESENESEIDSEEEEESDTADDSEMVLITIEVTVDGETIDDGLLEVEVEQDAILMDVMEENFEVVAPDGFVTEINGHDQNEDEGLYWMFDVNGEMAPVGAGEYELEDGDEVEWKLEPFEE